LTADKIVNSYTENEICRILNEYSDERFAKRIAKAIVDARRRKRIANCTELAGIVSEVYKGKSRREKIHPATRTFQALRICVNDELSEIKKGLEEAVDLLNTGGRLCAISYHSNEDRIVKNFLREADRHGIVRVITKKPTIASSEEARQNPSSRSAKLRGAEKI
jgi:16S rRNA (cytosine1402-N4)-methyltransferase